MADAATPTQTPADTRWNPSLIVGTLLPITAAMFVLHQTLAGILVLLILLGMLYAWSARTRNRP